jgi:PAS domain S-box-containing protein
MGPTSQTQLDLETENQRLRQRIAELEAQLAAAAGSDAGAGIAALKETEDALRESEARYRLLVEMAPDPILVLQEGRIVYCNAAALRLYDASSPAALLGKPLLELIHPGERDAVRARLQAVAAGIRTPRREFRHRRLDGREVRVESVAAPVNWRGRPAAQAVIRDVSDRRRLEEELRRHVEELETLMDVAPVAIWVSRDPSCHRITGNRTANEFYEALTGENVSAGPTPGDPIPPRRFFRNGRELNPEELTMQKAAATGMDVHDEELDVLLPSGKERIILGHASPLRDESGQVRGCIGAFLDITRRRRTEEALRHSERQLQDIIDGAPSIVFVKDREGRFTIVNRALAELLGKSSIEIKAAANYDPFPPEWAEHDRMVLESGRPEQVEETATLGGARERIFLCNRFPLRDHSGTIYGVCSIATDITDRKKADEQLRQSQKLESLGLLAGGVAHDFNNLLVGVIGNASLALDLLPPGDPSVELLDRVIRTGEQAAHLTRQMLAYSGKGRFLLERLDLSALVTEISSLVQPSISKKIALEFRLAPGLPAIEADRGQVQQVFMNLVINAAEAIGGNAGLITVSTGIEQADERCVHENFSGRIRPGPHVCLQVRDTGPGMDEATRAKIFDPFFSTKFTGRGLGLAAVAGIVRGHNGAIRVETAPGQGTCFTVFFPAAEGAIPVPAVVSEHKAVHGRGTILVVDDEELVRHMAKRALERCGFTVLVARNGETAIDTFKRHPGAISAVVLDLSMPGMSGAELLPELLRIRPDVKVLVSSGYNEMEALRSFEGYRVAAFVQKPYTANSLAAKVKLALA